MEYVGHRGLRKVAPENTLAGLEAAFKIGYHWVEIDVQLTKDQEVIVFHDYSLDRCTEAKGLVKDFTLKELKELDAGSFFSKEFTGESIPTLKEYLARALELGIKVNVEIKGDIEVKETWKSLTKESTKIMSSFPNYAQNFICSSFEQSILEDVYDLDKTIPLGCLVDAGASFAEIKVRTKALPFYSIHWHHSLKMLMPLFKEVCVVWTVNDRIEVEELRTLGCKYLITDVNFNI